MSSALPHCKNCLIPLKAGIFWLCFQSLGKGWSTRWWSYLCLYTVWSYLAHLYLPASCPKLGLIFCPISLDPIRQQQCTVQSYGYSTNCSCVLYPLGMLVPVKGARISSLRLPCCAGQRQKWGLWPASVPCSVPIPALQATRGGWEVGPGWFLASSLIPLTWMFVCARWVRRVSQWLLGNVVSCQMPVKDTGRLDGSLLPATISEPSYRDLTQISLSTLWACSAPVGRLSVFSPLFIYFFSPTLTGTLMGKAEEMKYGKFRSYF